MKTPPDPPPSIERHSRKCAIYAPAPIAKPSTKPSSKRNDSERGPKVFRVQTNPALFFSHSKKFNLNPCFG